MKFNPTRLILARKRRGLSKMSLAVESGLSVRMLGYYESGEIDPPEESLKILAQSLRFPIPFFYADDLDEIACDAASFRALSVMTASQRDASLAAGTFAVELSRWIDQEFELPPPDVPSFSSFDPETAAQALRAAWGIGERPINNVVHLLEAHGIRVFSLPIDSAAVDAFSAWHRNTPFVFLNPKKSGERGRMDASHELGHLTLHRSGIPRSRETELEADKFASAFLMPAKDVLAHIPRGSLTLPAIHKLKIRWKVSAIALVHRLKDLNLITEWQYRTFCIELSKAGYRRTEKDGIPRESSQVFAKVFEALRAEGKTRHAIARELHLTSAELDSLLLGLIIAALPENESGKARNPVSVKSDNRPVLKIV